MDKIRLSAMLQSDSVVDGEGLRCVLWTQGCPHRCVGCHNPSTHEIEGGFLKDIDELCAELTKISYHDGLTISGGEPFLQVEQLFPIIECAKNLGMNVWVYTGYTIDELLEMSNPRIKQLLEMIDILVDGRFVQTLFSYDLLYCGSSNQNIINMKEYFKGS